ncbi:hypothetical protein BBJ28_00023711, partial [Nothophytophthora sp. Chile5]
MVVGALVWEATSPVRRLVGFVVGKVYRKADHWAFLLWQCVERYQRRVSSVKVAALCVSESLWVRFAALFLVPSSVLRKHCGNAEGLGKACLKWLDAHYYSWCVLVSTTVQEALASMADFWNGVPTVPAETSACLADLFWAFWALGKLMVFASLYGMASLYAAIELCCLGWVGTSAALLAARYWLDDYAWCAQGTAVFGVYALCSRASWLLLSTASFKDLTPGTLALHEWAGVRERDRRRAQQARVVRAAWRAYGDERRPPPAEGHLGSSDDPERSQRMGRRGASVPEVELERSPLQGNVPVNRSLTAIQAEYREATLRATELRIEYEASRRAEASRRGRRETVGENCPVSRQTRVLQDSESRARRLDQGRPTGGRYCGPPDSTGTVRWT